jgi:hypothetical protein
MTVESFRWLVTPGCGVAAVLLVYDAHRALRPRIAGEQPWRESHILGMATLVLGAFVLQGLEGRGWLTQAIGVVLTLAIVPLVWSSVTLRRLVAEVLQQNPEDESAPALDWDRPASYFSFANPRQRHTRRKPGPQSHGSSLLRDAAPVVTDATKDPTSAELPKGRSAFVLCGPEPSVSNRLSRLDPGALLLAQSRRYSMRHDG